MTWHARNSCATWSSGSTASETKPPGGRPHKRPTLRGSNGVIGVNGCAVRTTLQFVAGAGRAVANSHTISSQEAFKNLVTADRSCAAGSRSTPHQFNNCRFRGLWARQVLDDSNAADVGAILSAHRNGPRPSAAQLGYPLRKRIERLHLALGQGPRKTDTSSRSPT